MRRILVPIVLVLAGLRFGGTTWAAPLEGRFYPEKQAYLIGEPIFVVLDLTNSGPRAVRVSHSCAWLDTRFEAPTASKPRPIVSMFGCSGGTAGSCGGSADDIPGASHLRRRYLLDGQFLLEAPGTYPIHAWHKVDIYSGDASFRVIGSLEVNSNFDLTVVAGTQAQLVSAYAPILREVERHDWARNWLAREALVQNPPAFLEDFILKMADDPQTVGYSIPGLRRLATARTKAKLAELATAGNPTAIESLGALGDRAYCSVMLDVASKNREYSRFIALRAAGYLCGEDALPALKPLLTEPDYSTRFEALYALGNTHCRDAVPSLISMLTDPDPNVRRAAADALAALTHRRANNNGETPQTIQSGWALWWTSKGTTAVIYGIGECAKPEPLT